MLSAFAGLGRAALVQQATRRIIAPHTRGMATHANTTIAPLAQKNSKRKKHRTPRKKASKLLNELVQEEFQRMKGDRQWPNFMAGDVIKVDRLPYVTATEPDSFKGIVIAKVNRASDSAMIVASVEFGTPVVRRVVMYSPLIKNVEVINRNVIRKDNKRTRRSKIYYLLERDPKFWTF